MTAVDELARAIISVATPRGSFPTVGLVVGRVTVTRYFAGSVSEVDVMGVTDEALTIPVGNWLASFQAAVQAAPTSITGREVLILVSASRAFVVGLMGSAT